MAHFPALVPPDAACFQPQHPPIILVDDHSGVVVPALVGNFIHSQLALLTGSTPGMLPPIPSAVLYRSGIPCFRLIPAISPSPDYQARGYNAPDVFPDLLNVEVCLCLSYWLPSAHRIHHTYIGRLVSRRKLLFPLSWQPISSARLSRTAEPIPNKRAHENGAVRFKMSRIRWSLSTTSSSS